MLSRKRSRDMKRLLRTPIEINPKLGEAAWSIGNGQGYYRSYTGQLIKITDPMPEGYREERLAERDRKVQAL